MTQRKGRFFVVSGPAGVGKSTIVNRLLEKHPEIMTTVSCTTRKPRPNEVNGVDYTFMTVADFFEKANNGGFFEIARVHENWYGTPADQIHDAVSNGKDIIAVLDTKGWNNVKEDMPLSMEKIGIFICPPNINNLIERLNRRGTETKEEIKTRVTAMLNEFKMANTYDYVLINQDEAVVPNAVDYVADQIWNIMCTTRYSIKSMSAKIMECGAQVATIIDGYKDDDEEKPEA